MNGQFIEEEKVVKTEQHSLRVGFPIYIFDMPGFAAHVGYDINYPLNKRWDIEGLISYSLQNFNRSDAPLGRDGGKLSSINVLGGVRFYLFKGERKSATFLNVLVGYANVQDHVYNADGILNKDKFHSFGYSTGIYQILKNGINLGVSFDAYGSVVLKIGYTF